MPLITINDVQKYYGDNHVLKGVSTGYRNGRSGVDYWPQRLWQKHIITLYEWAGRLPRMAALSSAV